MARTCVKCGKSVGPFSGRIRYRLKDPDTWICRSCWKALGFDTMNADVFAASYTWDDIKDGKSEYYKKRHAASKAEPSPLVTIKGADGNRDPNPTQHEAELFELCRLAIEDSGRDPERLELVRRSDAYVTAAIGLFDVCRIKYSPRAKWIQFPYDGADSDKRYLGDVYLSPDDEEALLRSYDLALANANNGIAYERKNK